MKIIFIGSMLVFVHAFATAQVSNTRAGNWSDPAVWSNWQIPNGVDSVTLKFDIVIDENAACKILLTNGHTVTVKTGVDFGVGKPLLAIDTATLLTITTTAKFQGGSSDSVKRVLKNSYVNRVKRIEGIEDHGLSGTAYTLFTYNDQNQLVSLVAINHDPTYLPSRTSISWSNNRVSKLVTEEGWQKPRVESISYILNGANTDVVVTQVDTVLDSRSDAIKFIKTQKKVL
ncbi:MAG: hypothetical protein Q7T76_06290, partial [Ferruginibacter sp.]|nr:hypothetical protein [Ferruginibacter sp.]